ncbi:MAG: hypothetical protein K0S08_1540 [Gammaproteobacteria bacterium]|jgi:hypothetical protein|nr:hypothetical protein [Gammaproteobacteria bacterium]
MFNQYLALFIFLLITTILAWSGKYKLSIALFILFLIGYLAALAPHFHTHYGIQF